MIQNPSRSHKSLKPVGEADEIKGNSLLQIPRDVLDNGSMVFISVMKRGLIAIGPNTIENRLHQVARNSGPLRINRGPSKEKNGQKVHNKLATQNHGENRSKVSPDSLDPRAVKKALINGLSTGVRCTGGRGDVTPNVKGVTNFNREKSNKPSDVILKVLSKGITYKRPVNIKRETGPDDLSQRPGKNWWGCFYGQKFGVQNLSGKVGITDFL